LPFRADMSEGEFLAEVGKAFSHNRANGYGSALGIELEGHLFVPGAVLPSCLVHEVEDELNAAVPYFVHEVHGGRLEVLTDPQPDVPHLVGQLEGHLSVADRILECHGLILTAEPIIMLPEDHLSVVYPKPRYVQKIDELGHERGRAALAVASLQFHRGVDSWEKAIAVYQAVRQALPKLTGLGDLSRGERFRICETWCGTECYAAADLQSPHDVWLHANRFGWVGEPKGFWSRLRINCYRGTIELRTPDASRDLSHISRLAEAFAVASSV